MIPDPMLGKLARFTPNGRAVDRAALLFAAGRASARTHWVWKISVAVLLLANAGWVGLRLYPPNSQTTPRSDLQAVPTPTETPQAEPLTPPASDDPWSYRALLSAGDPERFPATEPLKGQLTIEKPLTPRMALRGELD